MNDTNLQENHEIFKSKVSKLLEKLPEENSTKKQLTNYLELFEDSLSYLLNKNHRLAFIGNIGAGKTTAICHILNLLDKKKPILSTGSGRTTLCEVNIHQSNELKIEVEPYNEKEVVDYLEDFSFYLSESGKASGDKRTDSFKLSAEIERALRNMLNLKISRTKSKDEKRITIDTAKEFALQFENISLLKEALLKRIDLASRTQRIFKNEHDLQQNEWLHKTFKEINSATNPNVGLSKNINIFIPQPSMRLKVNP